MPDHNIDVDLNQITAAGEYSYTCLSCNQSVIIVWNGYTDDSGFHATNWGPRLQDANDPKYINLNINYL